MSLDRRPRHAGGARVDWRDDSTRRRATVGLQKRGRWRQACAPPAPQTTGAYTDPLDRAPPCYSMPPVHAAVPPRFVVPLLFPPLYRASPRMEKERPAAHFVPLPLV